MMLTARLSVYLFKIGQKLHKGERVDALMKCPECDFWVHDMTEEQKDQHILITQRIYNNRRKYKDIEYAVVGCEGYWIVDPQSLGLPRGNWSPTWEIIKKRLALYAEDRLGWDLEKLALEEDNKAELAGVINEDDKLDTGEKAD